MHTINIPGPAAIELHQEATERTGGVPVRALERMPRVVHV